MNRNSLREYRNKRDFAKTTEPAGRSARSREGRLFVVQKHAASRLHYDFRLELNGVLKSWAVPKGPSLDPHRKRLAVEVEDHPIEYGSFEGVIPPGEYGGGTVMLWDTGSWQPEGDPEKGYREGLLKFHLNGRRLSGGWTLARLPAETGAESRKWLLIKKKDASARPGSNSAVLKEHVESAVTQRSMQQIARAATAVWESGRETKNLSSADPLESDPSRLSGSRRGPLPDMFRPQLATAATRPPPGEKWLHEIKFDGYRVVSIIDRRSVRMLTRNGKDWTERFADIAAALAALPVENAVLDGEVVVVKPDGTTDFQKLQNALKGPRKDLIVYYLFDLPYCQGYDLSHTPLRERKELLSKIVAAQNATALRYSDHIEGAAEAVYRHACRYALEGIVSKQAASPYEQQRTRSWIKVKCLNRQEFVIGGYTDPGGSRSGFGALLLGYYDDKGRLVYAGRVGTGFSDRTLASLLERLSALGQEHPPFTNPPAGREARGVHWSRPELVAEVEFTAWTREGILRHPAFKGLREDKSAREVVRETPEPPPAAPQTPPGPASSPETAAAGGRSPGARTASARVANVALTHRNRILFPDQGVSKIRLARYYEEISAWILPHVVDRPLAVVRCPQGSGQDCFFQKHVSESLPPSIRGISIRENKKEEENIYIEDLTGLIALVQLGVLEIHPWGSRIDRIERPDRMTFDLDPGPQVDWPAVVSAARLLHDRLAELKLASFVKTSGGKGLHVVVPLVRRSSWDEVRAFAEAFTRGLVRGFPSRYVATMTKSKRSGKIFIDFFRNNRGATSVAAYSTRARPHATVSTPLAWQELSPGIRSDTFTIADIPARLKNLASDPWSGFFDIRQSLTKALRKKVDAVSRVRF